MFRRLGVFHSDFLTNIPISLLHYYIVLVSIPDPFDWSTCTAFTTLRNMSCCISILLWCLFIYTYQNVFHTNLWDGLREDLERCFLWRYMIRLRFILIKLVNKDQTRGYVNWGTQYCKLEWTSLSPTDPKRKPIPLSNRNEKANRNEKDFTLVIHLRSRPPCMKIVDVTNKLSLFSISHFIYKVARSGILFV